MRTYSAVELQLQNSTGLRGVPNTARASTKHTLRRTEPQRANSGQNEAMLIARLQTGDEQALETMFNLYSARLFNVAQRILGEAADAQEVIQDVFWAAYRKAKTFRGNSRFSTWLYRLTVNAALGKMRRSRRNREVQYEDYLPKFAQDGHHSVRPVIDWSQNVEDNYAREEMQALLAEALGQLKPVDKSVVVLSDLEALSDKEIAATLGLSVSAVKTRLHRARLFLRGKLAAHFACLPA